MGKIDKSVVNLLCVVTLYLILNIYRALKLKTYIDKSV